MSKSTCSESRVVKSIEVTSSAVESIGAESYGHDEDWGEPKMEVS